VNEVPFEDGYQPLPRRADATPGQGIRGTIAGRMDEDRQERLAKNESLFRSLNENINDLAARLGGTRPFEFICECSTSGCFERLSLTLPEYERIRQNGTHFLLFPGHEDIEIEQVIATREAFVVVEKDGVAGLVAHDDNPRA
jgi:hypothetical protein